MMLSLSVSITVRNSKLGIYPLGEQNMYVWWGLFVCINGECIRILTGISSFKIIKEGCRNPGIEQLPL